MKKYILLLLFLLTSLLSYSQEEDYQTVYLGADGQEYIEIGSQSTLRTRFVGVTPIVWLNNTIDTIATYSKLPDLTPYATTSSITSSLEHKADLINGIVPTSQLPTSERTIIRGTATGIATGSNPLTATGFNDEDGNPVIPNPNVTYFGQVTNLTFLYNTSSNLFVSVGNSLALGETSSTAFRGDYGLIAYNYALNHNNVNNTSDLNKPISTATQTALNTKENTISNGTNLQYWRGDKTWQTLPTSLPNPQNLTFTGGSTIVYNGSSAQTVAIPILPTRVKVNHTTAIPTSGNMVLGTAYTLSTTATVASTQTNAVIGVSLTFDPDNSATVLIETTALKNIQIQCDFLIAGIVVDTKYKNIVRGDNLDSARFETVQNVTAGQIVSIRITATSAANGATINVPASTTSNYITIM